MPYNVCLYPYVRVDYMSCQLSRSNGVLTIVGLLPVSIDWTAAFLLETKDELDVPPRWRPGIAFKLITREKMKLIKSESRPIFTKPDTLHVGTHKYITGVHWGFFTVHSQYIPLTPPQDRNIKGCNPTMQTDADIIAFHVKSDVTHRFLQIVLALIPAWMSVGCGEGVPESSSPFIISTLINPIPRRPTS